MKKSVIITIAIILAVVIALVIIFIPKTTSQGNGIILYYGEGCPHCKNVDDFINQNSIKDKVQFVEKEVFSNQKNADELIKKSISCNLDISQGAPIPLLWDGSKCYVGDGDVIKFFKDKIGIK